MTNSQVSSGCLKTTIRLSGRQGLCRDEITSSERQGMDQIPQPIVKAEPEPEFAALVAIDWADQKHYWCLRAAGQEGLQRGCPTVPSSAPTCLFLDVSGLPQDTMGQLPVRSANAIFRGLVFEVADISLCPGLCVCVVSQIAPTAASFPTGQPRLLRPGISCFVTSARSGYAIRPIQVIDGKGTFTFPDLQPCRLLQCQTCIPGRFTLNNPRNVVVSPRNCP